MAGWVDDSRRSVSPELILSGNQDLRPHGDGTLHGLIHVRHVHEDDYRRTPIRIGYAAGHVWELGLNHQERLIDAQRYVNWRAIRARSSHLLDRPKRRRA